MPSSEGATPRTTGALSAAAYAGMFVFGVVMALLGAVLPALSERLDFRVADSGTLFLAMNFAMLACAGFLGLAIDRYGMKPPLVAGPLLVGAALALMARAGAFPGLIPAALLLGAGGGALNGATNTLVADLHPDPRRKGAALNLLGVFFGFGALLLPFAIGSLVAVFGIVRLLFTTAALCLLAGGYAAALRFPAPKQTQRLPVAGAVRLLRSPVVLAMALLLFFQSGIEFTLGGYLTTFLVREIHLTVVGASWMLAAYWASLMLARVVLSRFLLKSDPHRVIRICALTACAGSLLTAAATGQPSAFAAIVLTGLALAGIYPTVLGIAGARFREQSGTVFGILFTIALVGGMTLPWSSGRLADAGGLRWVLVLVACAFAAVAVLDHVVRGALRRPDASSVG